MQPLRPTPVRVGIALTGALIVIALLVGLTARPAPLASTLSASPATANGPSPSAAGTPSPTGTPATDPSPAPPADLCRLPEQLPPAVSPDAPIVAPRVEAQGVAMLFTSWLYERNAAGAIIARDETDIPDADWAVGLWQVPAGGTTPRLLHAPGGGMVLPLAVTRDGRSAAVWWLPQRRAEGEPPCEGAIYLVSLADGSSRLLVRGDWEIDTSDGSEGQDWPAGTLWGDPWTGDNTPRRYLLPAVTFSGDGEHVAVVADRKISLYRVVEGGPVREHLGSCTDWAWSFSGARFVAACEGATSAWIVDASEGAAPESIALPAPDLELTPPGWEVQTTATIGWTKDGDVRIVRFYGYATGCEVVDCFIPPPAYSVTTIDLATLGATSVAKEVDFLVISEPSYWDTRLSPDGTWAYARTYEPGDGRVLDLAVGGVHAAPAFFGVGFSSDAARLYFLSGEADALGAGPVVVASVGRGGVVRTDATLRLPEGATARDDILLVAGLQVTSP